MPKQSCCEMEALRQFPLRAMNTDIDVILSCKEEDLERLQTLAGSWFAEVEQRFSRFRPDSELMRLNTPGAQSGQISESMREVLGITGQYRQITEGIFNPFVFNALERAGYQASFENLGQKLGQNHGEKDSEKSSSSSDSPPKMDLGGIVKSWSVMKLVNKLQKKHKLKRGLINAGGDLSVWGNSAENGTPWLIGIENPWLPAQDIGMLALADGSVATSSILGRQWLAEQGVRHHLIDPRTMLPSTSDVVQCTVSGENVIECEIWAKVICILGLDAGLALLERKSNRYEALIFTSDKKTHYYGKHASLGTRWQEAPIDHFYHPQESLTEWIRGA